VKRGKALGAVGERGIKEVSPSGVKLFRGKGAGIKSPLPKGGQNLETLILEIFLF
jgi:hypothetical protein